MALWYSHLGKQWLRFCSAGQWAVHVLG